MRFASFIAIILLISQTASARLLEKVSALTPPYEGFAPQTPVALSISPTDRIYLLDARRALIAELDYEGHSKRQIGGPGSGQEQFSDPSDICAISGLDLFVADYGNDRIIRLDRELTYLAEYTSPEGSTFDLYFENPKSVLLGPQGDLFIADGSNDRILKIDPSGRAVFSFGDYGHAGGALLGLCRLELDPRGGLWVLDLQGKVTRFDEYGGFLRQIEADIAGAPRGLAVSKERVWVCSDSLLWAFTRDARQDTSLTLSQLDIFPSKSLVDLALRKDMLWILDASGALHRYKIGTAP